MTSIGEGIDLFDTNNPIVLNPALEEEEEATPKIKVDTVLPDLLSPPAQPAQMNQALANPIVGTTTAPSPLSYPNPAPPMIPVRRRMPLPQEMSTQAGLFQRRRALA